MEMVIIDLDNKTIIGYCKASEFKKQIKLLQDYTRKETQVIYIDKKINKRNMV